MVNQDIIKTAKTHLEQGQSPVDLGRWLVKEHKLSAVDLAVVLHETVKTSTPLKKSRGVSAAAASDTTVADATYLASLLVSSIPGVTPSEVAIAIKDPRNYPGLTAYEMGEVLKAPGVFPSIQASDMQTALLAAGYPQSEVTQAIAQLYPVSPVSYRRMGPAGASGQMPFDDNTLAVSGQTLTQIKLHGGNIIDSIQAVYGAQASSVHGGSGGGSYSIVIPADDPITRVSGSTGLWFGANYILQLTFKTRSGRVFGPYGDMQYANSHTPFDFQVEADEQITGFFGSATYGDNGKSIFLGSLGIIVKKQ